MEIVIKPYHLDERYFVLSIENYDYHVQIGWIKKFIFNDSVRQYQCFMERINLYMNRECELMLFDSISDAQYAIDILNSIVMLRTLTQ